MRNSKRPLNGCHFYDQLLDQSAFRRFIIGLILIFSLSLFEIQNAFVNHNHKYAQLDVGFCTWFPTTRLQFDGIEFLRSFIELEPFATLLANDEWT